MRERSRAGRLWEAASILTTLGAVGVVIAGVLLGLVFALEYRPDSEWYAQDALSIRHRYGAVYRLHSVLTPIAVAVLAVLLRIRWRCALSVVALLLASGALAFVTSAPLVPDADPTKELPTSGHLISSLALHAIGGVLVLFVPGLWALIRLLKARARDRTTL